MLYYSVTAVREILILKVNDILPKLWQNQRDEFKLVSHIQTYGSVFRITVLISHYVYVSLHFRYTINFTKYKSVQVKSSKSFIT